MVSQRSIFLFIIMTEFLNYSHFRHLSLRLTFLKGLRSVLRKITFNINRSLLLDMLPLISGCGGHACIFIKIIFLILALVINKQILFYTIVLKTMMGLIYHLEL